MRKLLRKCRYCNTYTISEQCPKCGKKTFTAHPPKFSPDDKYLELRMKWFVQSTNS